jgi:hypothetical protein
VIRGAVVKRGSQTRWPCRPPPDREVAAAIIDDGERFNDKLEEWENFYSFHRLYSGLDGQTPYERLRLKTTTPAA